MIESHFGRDCALAWSLALHLERMLYRDPMPDCLIRFFLDVRNQTIVVRATPAPEDLIAYLKAPSGRRLLCWFATDSEGRPSEGGNVAGQTAHWFEGPPASGIGFFMADLETVIKTFGVVLGDDVQLDFYPRNFPRACRV